MDMMCSVCWATSPPFQWHRASAPVIPNTKGEILAALAKVIPHEQLKSLTKEELKEVFKQHVRGQKHPCDPSQGLSTKNKAELQQINRDHGLRVTGTKGALMLQLREHWAAQCKIADSPSFVATRATSSSQPRESYGTAANFAWTPEANTNSDDDETGSVWSVIASDGQNQLHCAKDKVTLIQGKLAQAVTHLVQEVDNYLGR